MLTLTFVRFMHFVNGKETEGIFCFPVKDGNVTFTEQQLLQVLKINGYDATRIVYTGENSTVH